MGTGVSSRNVSTYVLQLESQIDRLWDRDSSDIDELRFSVEYQEVLILWDSKLARDGNHYVLPIPWRNVKPNFPNDKFIAEGRLVSLKQRLPKTHVYSRYDENIKVRGPFVQTLCIEKDSYMDAI